MIKKYIKNLLISLDQFGNVVLGGDPDETISSRVGKNYHGTFFETFINFIFLIKTTNHCQEAIEWDEGKNAIIK
jgi:hypothetical protein